MWIESLQLGESQTKDYRFRHPHARSQTQARTHTHTRSRLLMKVVPSQKEEAGFPHWLMTHWGNSCRCLCIITCYAVLPLTLHCCSHLRSPTASQNGLLKSPGTKEKSLNAGAEACWHPNESYTPSWHLAQGQKDSTYAAAAQPPYNTRLQIS